MNSRKTILVVDDTKENVEILIELLSERYDVMVALDAKSGIDIVKEERPDLILLDIMMPEMDGYEMCEILKSDETTQTIPIIFITAKTDEKSIEKAYDIGAVDYVSKPFKPKELLARVKKELKVQELIFELEDSQKRLKELSLIDHLTKLYNRRYFLQTSEHIFELTKRKGDALSVMIMDIDYFKNINDTYGHATGDKVLIYFSNELKHLSRKSDIVSRWGGEEFVMLLQDTDSTGAWLISEKIRIAIENLVIPLEDKKELKCTVSIGCTQVNILSDYTIEDSLSRADGALYEAKSGGRNMVCTRAYS